MGFIKQQSGIVGRDGRWCMCVCVCVVYILYTTAAVDYYYIVVVVGGVGKGCVQASKNPYTHLRSSRCNFQSGFNILVTFFTQAIHTKPLI